MLIKVGEATGPQLTVIETSDALNNQAISERFNTLISKIKTVNAAGGVPVAPFRSDDFLYFRTAIMHAAEKANFNDKGESVGDGKFEVVKSANGKDVWSWASSKGVHPYMNSNGDIFPEDELVKAATSWIGKGLYCNHQSSDVEKLRGIIIDTQYDSKSKALWALVALDRKNFPVLASQVQNGTIRNVSMGTAVKRSFCTLCGNEAVVEADYCVHIKQGLKNKIVDNGYGKPVLVGEINVGLNGVELSLVSIPADNQATIRHVYASLQSQFEQIRDEIDSGGMDTGREATLKDIKETLDAVKGTIERQETNVNTGGTSMDKNLEKRAADRRKALLAYFQGTTEPKPGQTMYPPDPKNEQLRNEELAKAKKEENETSPKMGDKGGDQVVRKEQQRVLAERQAAREKVRQAYMQGTTEPKSPATYTPDPTESKLRSEDQSKFQGEARETAGQISGDPAFKAKIQRGSKYLGAKFTYAKNESGEVAPEKSYWAVYAADEPDAPFAEDNELLRVTAGQAYGNDLHKSACDEDGNVDPNGRTNWAFIASKDYGQQLVEFVKSKGVDYVAAQFKKATDPALPGMGEGVGTDQPAAADDPLGGGLKLPDDQGAEDVGGEDIEEGGEKPTKDDILAVYDELGDKLKEFIGMDDFGEEDAKELDEVMPPIGESDEALTSPDASKEDKEQAAEGALGDEKAVGAFMKVVNFMKYADMRLEAKKNKDEDKDDKKGKDKKKDEDKDDKKGKDKKEDKDDKDGKGKDKDKEKDKGVPDKDGKGPKGSSMKGKCPSCGKPNFICRGKCKKASEDVMGTIKNATPTGNEVKDIAAPSNNSGKLTSPTGNEVKDIPDVITPYITDSVDSDNVGGQDMHVESIKEQHDKDLAAATSDPSGAEVSEQKSASDRFAAKVGESISAEALEQAKKLAVAKMKTAYELATEMAEKGYVGEREIKAKADELYAMSDEAFSSIKRVFAGLQSIKNETVKTASAVASLGNINGDRTMPAESAGQKTLAEHLADPRFGWK